ncbi:MAG: ABC transporter permease [Jiangellales bacterium]
MSLTATHRVHEERRTTRAETWAGTGGLVRLALRRDRVLMPAWLLGFTLVAVFSAAATRDLYPDPTELETAAETVNATAALVALYGKVYVTTSLGAVSLIKLTAFGAAFVAVLLVFVVVRHSRAEEESGRLELVAAGVVGRAAPLTAALLVGAGASLALGALTTVGLGLGGLPWAGSLAFGLGWALSGVVFSAVAAVTAQLTTSARAAIGLGLVGVGVSYALRAVGDLSSSGDPGWLSWLSPIGWSQQIRPFAGDRWWVTALPLLATALLVPLAFALRARRDLGSGMLQQGAGPATGSLRGVGALAWRLQRGSFVAWLAATAAMGVVLGSIANNISGFLDSAQMQEFVALLGGEQSIVDSFLAAEVGIFGAIVAAFGVSAALHLRSEETAGHAELLLTTPATRVRWASSHLGVALLGTAVIMLVTGTSIGLGYGLTTGEPLDEAVRLAGAAALAVPAAWVMVGIVAVLLGWVPLAAPGAWGLLAGFVVLGEFGGLWQLPQWVLDVSPFAHSPTVPGGVVSVMAVVGLLLVAGILIGIGVLGLRRRDIPA